MPVVSCSEAEFGTLTLVLVPLKLIAPPYLPVPHVAFAAVPLFPLPDESATLVPDPASNEYAATRPGVAADAGVAANATAAAVDSAAINTRDDEIPFLRSTRVRIITPSPFLRIQWATASRRPRTRR
jgi:hypothetical protein